MDIFVTLKVGIKGGFQLAPGEKLSSHLRPGNSVAQEKELCWVGSDIEEECIPAAIFPEPPVFCIKP